MRSHSPIALPLIALPFFVRASLIAALTVSVASGMVACGKSESKKDKLADNPFAPPPKPPKLDLGDIIVEESPDAAPGGEPTTWAGKVKERVAEAEADLQRCRNEFLIPFQFNSMKRRDVMFVDINLMDEVCDTGSKDKKTRGPRKILESLAKEQLGKHPQLDTFILRGLEQVETYYVFSYMTKKLGAPDLDAVVDIAQKAQQRILEAAPQLDRAAAEVAKLADNQAADDDASVAGAAVELGAFKQQLAQSYGPVVGDLATGYERLAEKSWQHYNMPKMGTLKAMVALLTKRAQQDRPRLAKVTGLEDKAKAEFETFFTAVEAAGKQVEAGYDFYKKPKDERPEHDPNFKKVKDVQKSLAKTLTGWGWASGEK